MTAIFPSKVCEGTHTLRFNFRFTTPGDGDFLRVSFGNNAPIFPGTDMPLTRDAELPADVPVDDVAGGRVASSQNDTGE